jgi:hypothetical protein
MHLKARAVDRNYRTHVDVQGVGVEVYDALNVARVSTKLVN